MRCHFSESLAVFDFLPTPRIPVAMMGEGLHLETDTPCQDNPDLLAGTGYPKTPPETELEELRLETIAKLTVGNLDDERPVDFEYENLVDFDDKGPLDSGENPVD